MSGTAKVVLVVVIGGVLVCGGLVTALIIGGAKLFDWAKGKLEEEMARDREWGAFATTWNPPPADANLARLFPATIKGFKLNSSDDQAAIPSLNIALAGSHGVYQSNGQTIEVFAWRVNNLEREAIYKRVIDNVRHGSGVNSHFQINARLRYSSTRLGEQGAFWGDGQWLFLARSPTNDDPEAFLLTYADAINGKFASKVADKPSSPSQPAPK
jgi:hypothetical protein